MGLPQKKSLNMKHPALARVFAVALAVMSVILLLAGYSGIEKAEKENAERLRYEERFAERIENYIALTEQVENSISYDEAYAELEKIMEKHEDDASQHKTDLAMYSAELGGNTMGANMIWEAMPMIKGAKKELEDGKALLEQKEAEMQQAVAGFAAADGNGYLNRAAAGYSACASAVNQLNSIINTLNSPVENPGPEVTPVPEPSPKVDCPTAPVKPIPPMTVEQLDEKGPKPPEAVYPPTLESTEPVRENFESDEAYNEAVKAHEDAVTAYNAALENFESVIKPAYDAAYIEFEAKRVEHLAYIEAYKPQYEEAMKAYNAAMEEYTAAENKYKEDYADFEKYEADLKAYSDYINYKAKKDAYDEWLAACDECQMKLMALGGLAYTQGEELAAITEPSMAIISNFAAMFGAGAGDMGGAAMPVAGEGAELTPEALLGSFQMMQQGFGGIQQGLGMISSGLALGEQEISKAKSELANAEVQLQKAEAEMHTQLANIWYNLGELEKDREDLQERRDKLNEEAGTLSKQVLETDELKELENDQISAKLLLTSVKEVNDMYTETEDLVSSANIHLENYKTQTVKENKGRIASCIFAIVGGVAGILGVPAAYELIRRRFWLIAPVVLCIFCGIAAEAAYLQVGLGWWYVGLFTAIIAALHLLVVAPKEKKPAVVTEI